MTAPSPVTLATSIPSYSITVNGSALDTSYQVVSIETWTGVNKLPRARLVISDGSAADATFAISETSALIPGVTLVIAMGYGSSTTTIFSGVIYRQGLEFTANGPSRLVVEATDKAMVMTLARANAIFTSTTDSSVISTLISTAGCTPDVTSTSTQHEAIVQYYSTPWDLMVLRAQASGMVVTVSAGTVTVAPPDTSTTAVLSLTFGQSILDFRADMDASTQLAASAIQSYAWDPATQALVQSSSASASVSTPGNISSSTLAGVFNVSPYLQQTGGEMVADELTQWSSAELLKSELSKIRGQVTFQGSALAVPCCMVTLAGLGARFNGDAFVSGVYHRLAEGLWITTVDIGLSPSWFAAVAPQIPAPGASGQLPPINNVQTGIVKQIDSDPDGEFRVLVTVPVLQASDGTGVWARFGSFYASNGIGSNFYPEIGDEVVLAFLNGDPRYPVILGSLYSKANPPPFPPTTGGDGAPNNTKSFMTKSKLHMDFIENLPKMQLVTPAAQSIAIDDSAGSIVLTDKNGNTITMDSSGITLKSASDITLTASGSIKATASADVTISASASFSTTASASAKLTCDGPVQIKGATVALNP
ncbi:MAG: type VI secretion system tip protein VgrG [Pseudomonadota bacterium]